LRTLPLIHVASDPYSKDQGAVSMRIGQNCGHVEHARSFVLHKEGKPCFV